MINIFISALAAFFPVGVKPVDYCREKIWPVTRTADRLAKALVSHLHQQYRYQTQLNRDDGGPAIVNLYCTVDGAVQTGDLCQEIARYLRRFRLNVSDPEIACDRARLSAIGPAVRFSIDVVLKTGRHAPADGRRRFLIAIVQDERRVQG